VESVVCHGSIDWNLTLETRAGGNGRAEFITLAGTHHDAVTGAECSTLAASELRSIDSAFVGPQRWSNSAADNRAECNSVHHPHKHHRHSHRHS
jgi:hypothetical protein